MRSQLALSADVREEASFLETAHGRIYSNRVIPQNPRAGVVICSSIHAELLSNYRAEVELARALGSTGIAVQRFHSIGQGHSDDGDVDVDSLVRDARLVTEAFRRDLDLHKVGFMGARLGAVIAASIASQEAPIAMWEPAVDGRSYLRNVFRAHAMFMMGEEDGETDLDRQPATTLEETGSAEVLGYRLDGKLCDGISRLSLMERLEDHTGRLLLVQLSKRQELSKSFKELATTFAGRMSTLAFREEPVWWLLRAPVEKLDVLVDSTKSWLDEALAEGAGR